MNVYEQMLRIVERRAYRTYQARLIATNRLRDRSQAWNACLVATATATTIAAIGLLADEKMYGSTGPAVLVAVSVLSLTVSLATSGLDYSGRSRNMFVNYRRIQRVSAEAERAAMDPSMHTKDVVDDLNARYDALLDESENHTAGDHRRVLADQKKDWNSRREQLVSSLPFVALLVPIGVLIPFVMWML
jgi:hypothetical protein